MKKEFIDGYEIIYSDNGEFKKLVYRDYQNNKISIDFTNELKEEFKLRKKELYAEDYKTRRYIDVYTNTNSLIEKNIQNIENTPEFLLIKEELKIYLIREIWKLPTPQNRRVYMYCVNNFSLTKIARIENCSIPTVKQSIDIGKSKIQEKIKKFLF